jgi:hypothetical protein
MVLPMSLSCYAFGHRRRATDRVAPRALLLASILAGFHLAAAVLMLRYEYDIIPKAAFILTWGLLNFFWIVLLRRPAIAAALSLTVISVLILLSELKYQVLG